MAESCPIIDWKNILHMFESHPEPRIHNSAFGLCLMKAAQVIYKDSMQDRHIIMDKIICETLKNFADDTIPIFDDESKNGWKLSHITEIIDIFKTTTKWYA